MHFVLTKAIVSPNNVKLYCRGEIFSESDYKDLQRNLGLDHIEALVCPDASAAATMQRRYFAHNELPKRRARAPYFIGYPSFNC